MLTDRAYIWSLLGVPEAFYTFPFFFTLVPALIEFAIMNAAMNAETIAALDHWKKTPLCPTDIPFVDAVRSLRGDHPLVEARMQGPSRWTVRIVASLLTAQLIRCTDVTVGDRPAGCVQLCGSL